MRLTERANIQTAVSQMKGASILAKVGTPNITEERRGSLLSPPQAATMKPIISSSRRGHSTLAGGTKRANFNQTARVSPRGFTDSVLGGTHRAKLSVLSGDAVKCMEDAISLKDELVDKLQHSTLSPSDWGKVGKSRALQLTLLDRIIN